ncbi:MAG: hypothetical protein WA656_10310, partial [Pseudolabrys sp.]
ANKESTNCRDHFFILPGTIVIEFKSLPMIAQCGKVTLRFSAIDARENPPSASIFHHRGLLFCRFHQIGRLHRVRSYFSGIGISAA